MRILKQAKEVGPQALRRSKVSVMIKEALGRVRERSSFLLIPAVKELPGKRNSRPRFHLTTSILAEFLDNLTSFVGGDHRMVEAKQIVTDVSKYLAFADRSNPRWSSLTQIDKLKAYRTHLTRAAIGPDGIITKIYRLIT